MSKLASPVTWAAVLATFGLIVIAVTEQTRTDVGRSIERVNHTLDVQRAFNLVLKGILDAETTQRGFVLTGDVTYLIPYREAERSMPAHIETLARTTADDAHHRTRVGLLRPLVAEKMRELQHTVDLAESGDRDAALVVVKTGRGRVLMERVRAQLDSAFVDEQRILRERQAGLDAALFRRSLLTIGMAIVLVLVAAVALHLQARVQRLQPFVTLCAWSKTVQDGDEWISFEHYLERRFGLRVTHGLSPEEVGKLLDDKRLNS
jgi:CHASE3 domain sensor protein